MPDPAWSAEYNMGQTPEQNGFTLDASSNATITLVTSGNPSLRRIEIDTSGGTQGIYRTTQIPALDEDVGVTVEADVEMSAAASGSAGFELTFLTYAILADVFESVEHPDQTVGPGVNINEPGGFDVIAKTDSFTTARKLRMLFHPNKTVELYFDGTQLIGPTAAMTVVKPFQRVMFWGEGGGTQIFRGFRYYTGGAVAPG